MTSSREGVPRVVSVALDGRPVRWLPTNRQIADYDGSERSLEVFNAAPKEQRALVRRLANLRPAVEEAAGGPVVVVFHTPAESQRLYWNVIGEWALTDSIVHPGRSRADLDVLLATLARAWPAAIYRELSGSAQSLRDVRAGRPEPSEFWVCDGASVPASMAPPNTLRICVARDHLTFFFCAALGEGEALVRSAIQQLERARFAERELRMAS